MRHTFLLEVYRRRECEETNILPAERWLFNGSTVIPQFTEVYPGGDRRYVAGTQEMMRMVGALAEFERSCCVNEQRWVRNPPVVKDAADPAKAPIRTASRGRPDASQRWQDGR
jgi:hypothetical protein